MELRKVTIYCPDCDDLYDLRVRQAGECSPHCPEGHCATSYYQRWSDTPSYAAAYGDYEPEACA